MSPYEREYFVSRIRSGFYIIKLDGFTVKVLTPRVEDEFFANEVFLESFDRARKDELMTEAEMHEWLVSRDLWSSEKDEKISGLEENLEKLKTEIFESRNKEQHRERVRLYIRATEKGLVKLRNEKNQYFSKSCEGIAIQDKSIELFKRCCFVGNEPADFNLINIDEIFYDFNRQLLSEKQLREIARNEPWRSLYILKEQNKLFPNQEGRELSLDQKGLLIWSRMYDNIQESMDCPTQDVIDDDDMLDGWFIIQRKKAESERAKSELEQRTTNSKISNSDEIFVFTDSRKEADSINSMNSVQGEMIKKDRFARLKQAGTIKEGQFADQQLIMSNMAHEQIKDKFRR